MGHAPKHMDADPFAARRSPAGIRCGDGAEAGDPLLDGTAVPPSRRERGDGDYLFFTGVDAANDQRLGYASTALLDTTDTVWDPDRKRVWQAEDTRWAVPDPWMYGGQTQFRGPYVVADPDDPERLLLF